MNPLALTSTLDLITIPRSKKADVAEKERQGKCIVHHPRLKQCGSPVHLQPILKTLIYPTSLSLLLAVCVKII